MSYDFQTDELFEKFQIVYLYRLFEYKLCSSFKKEKTNKQGSHIYDKNLALDMGKEEDGHLANILRL